MKPVAKRVLRQKPPKSIAVVVIRLPWSPVVCMEDANKQVESLCGICEHSEIVPYRPNKHISKDFYYESKWSSFLVSIAHLVSTWRLSCKQQAITAGDKSNHKQVFCTAQHSYLWLISPSKNVFFLSDWWLPGSFRPVFRLVRLQPSSLQKKKTDLPVAHYQVITLDHNLLREKKLTLNLSK